MNFSQESDLQTHPNEPTQVANRNRIDFPSQGSNREESEEIQQKEHDFHSQFAIASR